VSGGGAGLLALPVADDREYRIRLRWDLGGLAPGATAFTSLGEGDVDVVATLANLRRSFFVVGPLGRYPARGDVDGFSAAWLGTPADADPDSDMPWAARAYRAMRASYRDSSDRKYRFMLRALPEPNTSGGSAGLRHDEVTSPFDTRTLTGGSRAVITLDVVRDGRPLRIEYTPDPIRVTTYEWSRAPDVPDDVCRRG
jgi:hypothetical protein